MKQAPLRLRETADADAFTRELLGAARPTRPLPELSASRGARRVARLAAVPVVVAGITVWSKLVAAAFGAGFVSAIAVVSLSPAVRERLTGPAPVAQPGPVRPTVRPIQVQPRPAMPPAAAPIDSAAPATSAIPQPPKQPEPPKQQANEPKRLRSTTIEDRASLPLPRAPELENESTAPVAPERLELGSLAPSTADAGAVARPSAMTEEVELLTQARRLLASDPAAALRLLNRHAARFPGGALALEREVLVVDALGRAGEHREAEERARELLESEPGVLYTSRLRALLRSRR